MCAVINAIAPGRLVDLAALDADQPVLHHVQPPDALRAGPLVEVWMACSIDTFSPSMAIGTPDSKVITTSSAPAAGRVGV
jgi:hypothetical protein